MKIKSHWVLLIVTTLLLIGCEKQNNVVFDEYSETKGAWDKKDLKTFVVETNDTITKHNLYMNLRVNKEYEYSNMFVILKIFQPNETTVIDTLEYQIAKADGTLIGQGFSDVKENKLWMKEGYKFPVKGSYKFTLEQAVRKLGTINADNSLGGVLEVGLRVEKSE
ncbi:MAG: gliding motility lipoprotein GldH [Flavobacteriaceae bacterium]|jgi:gliding motility-associated lipoprotein GldH|nr:gliding motility lipoprotein GldH [Flavobacteriaceae bacterium]